MNCHQKSLCSPGQKANSMVLHSLFWVSLFLGGVYCYILYDIVPIKMMEENIWTKQCKEKKRKRKKERKSRGRTKTEERIRKERGNKRGYKEERRRKKEEEGGRRKKEGRRRKKEEEGGRRRKEEEGGRRRRKKEEGGRRRKEEGGRRKQHLSFRKRKGIWKERFKGSICGMGLVEQTGIAKVLLGVSLTLPLACSQLCGNQLQVWI